MKATYRKYILQFKQPSGTSRGVFTEKETWFLELHTPENKYIGECGLLRGLSIDDRTDYQEKLQWVCQHIHLDKETLWEELMAFPSIQFGVEQIFTALNRENPAILFPSEFTTGQKGISINGLIWMGTPQFMKNQIKEKLKQNFRCIKMKIGALNFDTEYQIIKQLRNEFPTNEIEIRVDANGSFSPHQALEKLKRLSDLQLHSIEQPIATSQWEEMALLCEKSPLPIALDEELIGVFSRKDKETLLSTIRPQYIILKPSLIGGYKGSEEWISLAEKQQIGWWITSALESNIGLNAIAQWTFTLQNPIPQGLGTGSLYTNNIESNLQVRQGHLFMNNS
ncbi:o-succinylbenzoate synthase [Capnocytophaga catalasegens]|uniref:O-succinylbenzoate synthase n=1 Tax=Capnocytophaga catalasegens TaxID=1004260 RepID=A0AAV5AZF7_9FLAO|nr:o-succinylbenzoate synthase [Capnocytophaga catalasegens]GIZ16170.1 o-succinylbenzoate synthase [Capnocytophaga catalasegens]GJM50886.1 o-succinylbenzoate synthase [Capnocytophaga catalasegens]GJM53730.1 o-succinylbenzoate synthase [Capnocytophaga catalasegens]